MPGDQAQPKIIGHEAKNTLRRQFHHAGAGLPGGQPQDTLGIYFEQCGPTLVDSSMTSCQSQWARTGCSS
jgi:hypothetical protein